MFKRYLVFMGDHYYPGGGWNDFSDSFDDWDLAKSHALAKKQQGVGWPADWAQIVDTETGEVTHV